MANRMIGKFRRTGGSHSIIVPPAVWRALQLRPGDVVEFKVAGRVGMFQVLDFGKLRWPETVPVTGPSFISQMEGGGA